MKKSMKQVGYAFYIVLALFLLSGCGNKSISEIIGEDVRQSVDQFNKGYSSNEQKREYIGMSATLIYLRETNQVDSVSIDLLRLIEIQDSVGVLN